MTSGNTICTGNSYVGINPNFVPWELVHPRFQDPDGMGMIPSFLRVSDKRPARDQFDDRYSQFGGWRSVANQSLLRFDDEGLHFPSDPTRPLLAVAKMRGETIRFYHGSYVAIFQPDGSFDVARID